MYVALFDTLFISSQNDKVYHVVSSANGVYTTGWIEFGIYAYSGADALTMKKTLEKIPSYELLNM